MESPGQHAARDLAILAGVMAVVVVPSMFVRDLWNPDEPRYTEVAREMAVTGRYLIPHLNGVIYPDKPPFFFWAAALLWKLGVGFNSGRVLSALSGLVTVWAVYVFTRRFLPRTPPLLAALATSSTILFTVSVAHGVIDPVLTALVTGALMCGYAALHDEGRRATVRWVGVYGLAGLGALTKGPVGFVVPALVLLVYAVLDRNQVKKGGWSHAWGVLLFAGVVLAWLVPAVLAGGHEYADTILIKQNLGRAVSSYSHRNPPYYFLLRLPSHYFPWALVLPFAGWAAYRMRKSGEAGGALFATTWVVVYVVFFSLISGKRAGYILPIAPALGILAAWYLEGPLRGEPRTVAVRLWVHRIAFGLLAVVSVAVIAAAALARPLLPRIEKDPSLVKEALVVMTPVWQIVAIALLLAPAAVIGLGLVHAVKARRVSDYMLASAILVLAAAGLPCVGSAVNVFKSGRLFCHEAMPYLRQARVVNLFPQDYSGVYNLYTGIVSMPAIDDEDALKAALDRPGTIVIGQRKSLLNAFTPDELSQWTLMERNVGHREMLLLGAPGRAPVE
jgi:4-amino-4-deoxy-L-arabinose transferase-like glycosyltransferase